MPLPSDQSSSLNVAQITNLSHQSVQKTRTDTQSRGLKRRSRRLLCDAWIHKLKANDSQYFLLFSYTSSTILLPFGLLLLFFSRWQCRYLSLRACLCWGMLVTSILAMRCSVSAIFLRNMVSLQDLDNTISMTLISTRTNLQA